MRSVRSAAVPAIHSSSSLFWHSALAPMSRCFRSSTRSRSSRSRASRVPRGLGVLVARTDAGRILPLSHRDFRDLREQGRAFAGFAGTSMDAYSLGLGTRGERVVGEMVTGNYFEVLGVQASLGRTLLPSDDVSPGKHPVVVISDVLWRRAFASDPQIVGKTIQVNAYPFTIVGVIEPEFQGSIVSLRMDLFLPVMMLPQLRGVDLLAARESPLIWGLGRLQPDSSISAAAAEADILSVQLDAQQPARRVGQRATVIPMWSSPYGAQTYMLPAILLLSAMGALLLLIVCANVSNLVLVRGVSRRGEVAIARVARRQPRSHPAMVVCRELRPVAARCSPGNAGVSWHQCSARTHQHGVTCAVPDQPQRVA